MINPVKHGMRELKKYQLHKMGVKLLCPRIKFSRLQAKGQKQLRLLDFWLSVFVHEWRKESSKNMAKIWKKDETAIIVEKKTKIRYEKAVLSPILNVCMVVFVYVSSTNFK